MTDYRLLRESLAEAATDAREAKARVVELEAALESERAAHAEAIELSFACQKRYLMAALQVQSLERELEAARKCIEAVRAEAARPGTIGQFFAVSLAAFEEYAAAKPPPSATAGTADEGAAPFPSAIDCACRSHFRRTGEHADGCPMFTVEPK